MNGNHEHQHTNKVTKTDVIITIVGVSIMLGIIMISGT